MSYENSHPPHHRGGTSGDDGSADPVRYRDPRVMPLPPASSPATHVHVDGAHYCSFYSLADARAAVELWKQHWERPGGGPHRVQIWGA